MESIKVSLLVEIKIERTRETIKLDGQMENHLVFHTCEKVERASFFYAIYT